MRRDDRTPSEDKVRRSRFLPRHGSQRLIGVTVIDITTRNGGGAVHKDATPTANQLVKDQNDGQRELASPAS